MFPRRLEKAVAILAACVLGVTTPGCNLYRSTARQLTQWVSTPGAQVVGVQVVEETAAGAKVEVTLRVENTNSVDLPLERARYRLRVGGRSHRYECAVHRTLPRSQSQVVVLIAAVGKVAGGRVTGEAYELDGEASYQPPGELRSLMTDVHVPLPSFGFEARGTLVAASGAMSGAAAGVEGLPRGLASREVPNR